MPRQLSGFSISPNLSTGVIISPEHSSGYRIPMSYIFKIPRISNEEPNISIEIPSIYQNTRYFELAILKYQVFYRLFVKPGIQERGTECGKREQWGKIFYSRECRQTFWGTLPKILGTVLNHSREYPQTFWECRLAFQGIQEVSK